MTLLLVGDDFDQTVLLIDHLRKTERNLTLLTAMTASDAVSLLAKYRGKISAIICFIGDAKKRGLDFATVVRRLKLPIPFFVLTEDRGLSEEAALKAGATRLFHRPVSVSELMKAVKKAHDEV